MNRYQASLKEKGILFLIAWLFCIALPGYSGTSGFQEYLIPGQEALLRSHYVYLDNDPAVGNTMHCVISVTASTDGTIINYDHWENGYGTPDETYTLNTGQYKVFESGNIPANPRGTSTYYDGGDRITVIGGPAFVSRASWPEDPGTVMALAFEILPIQALSNAFEMPVGSDLYQNDRSEPFADFERVVLMVQSTRDNNAVTIYGPDNAVIYSGTLNKGQSAVDTDLRNVRKGTRVTATWPVQIQFLTALEVTGTSSQINGFTGLPTALWGRRYAVPVTSFPPRSSTPASRTDLYLYNPNSQPITVTYRDSTTGSFTIAAKQLASFALKTGHYVPRNYGVDLTGSSTFWGFGIAGTGYDSWDWGLIFIPKEYCRTQYVVGWAPGDLNKTNNYSAVFVMPFRNSSTIFVDYDQNGTVDNTYTASRPQVVRIVDPNDRDMTGARIWSPDTLAMNYGEISGDPTVTGSPALDLGYTLIPLAEQFVDQVLSIEKGVNIDTVVVGHPAEFTLTVTTYSYLVGSIKVRDFMPPGWDYVTGSAVVSFSNGNPPQQVEPAQSGTVAAGLTLFWDLNYTLNPNQTITIAFSIYPTATAAAGVTENCAEVQGTNSGNTFTADGCGFIYNQPAGDIGDQVWNDLNRNGIQDAGEPGLPNVTVAIYTAGGTLAGSTVTDSDGRYLFSDLLPGDYYLQFTAPAGYALSAVDQGGDDGLDSDADPATGRTAATTLTSGEIDLGWDAGLYILVPDIHLEKSTNGMDADLPAGPSVPVGDAVTWSYTVTNPGDVPLSGVTVTDNQSGVQPEYLSGDDGDNLLEPGEIWIFQAAGVAAAGQYQNIGTAFGRYNGQSVSDTDPSHYFGGQAGILIKKYSNGEDADAPPGPVIPPGAEVTWRYVITNTGNVAISNILVSDSESGVTPAYLSGDDGDGLLNPGESWTFEASGTAAAGQYVNVGTVNGTDVYSRPVSDNDLAHYFGPAPAIQIEKLVNGEDADVPAGPAIPVGQAVQWSYIVTNPGNVPLGEVAVTDDQGVTPVAVDASPADGYNDGDADLDQLLDPGETWTWTASGSAIAGPYLNTGTASGRYGDQSVSDSDPSHYFGGFASIRIEKKTNGEDADTPTGPAILVGQPVFWRYEVSNPGNTAIRDVAVSDSRGVTITPVDIAPADGFTDGDADADGQLDPNETWLFEATGTAEIGQYSNIGRAEGINTLTGEAVSDEDPSHYFGASPSIRIKKYTNGEDADTAPGPTVAPGAAITWRYVVTNNGNVPLSEITVNDDQIVVVPVYLSGDVNNDGLLDLTETWIYEAYGSAVLGQYVNTGIAIGLFEEAVCQGLDPSHYFCEWPRASLSDYVWNDLNRNGLQDPGEPGLADVSVALFTIDGLPAGMVMTNSDGRYLFENLVPGGYYLIFSTPAGYGFTSADAGDDNLDSDPDPVTGRTSTITLAPGANDASQDAGLYALVPALRLEKVINGEDADLPAGPSVPVGGTVTWNYQVSNPGDVALAEIQVTDSDASVTPVYQSGDDGNSLLDPGETWIYSATATAVPGQYQNVGTATGRYQEQTLTASDPAHYFGGQAAIGIKKSTNGEDANEQPGPYITPGEAVTWSYLITNLGNVAISNLLVTDSESSVTPAYLSGDDGDGMLNPGESWLYQASGTALAGQYGNVGSVYGTDIFGQPVTASDASHYFGPSPSLRIKKMTNGEDADLPIGPAIPAGQPVLWSYVVTNTGNIHLANVTVTDDQGLTPQAVDIAPADGYNDGDLDLDHLLDLEEIWTYTASGLAVAGQYANTGTVTAEFNGQMVNSSDPSHYFGGQGAIEIEKSTNGLDADSEPGPAILAGAPVEWRYRVRNIGNTPVRDLAVSDDRGVTPAAVDIAPADGFNDGDTDLDGLLDTSEIWEFIASGTALAGQYANVGSVTGLDALTSLPLSDEDPSHYFGAVPAIAIEKLTNGEDADSEPGPAIILDGTVTWRYVVTNTGNVPLDSITVVDSDTSVHPLLIFGDLDSDQKLDLDETWIFEASAAARAGQYANIGTASGRFNGTAFQASDPSHYYCEGRMDFGDARDPSYPTLLASDGARHILSDLYLGALIDTENDGIVSANNTGDDLAASDDEDGILFPSLPFIQNSQNEVMVISSGAGFLNAWIDFNRDGDWMDAGEKILSDQPVAAGSESLLFQVPDIDPDAAPEIRAMNARFRLSSQPGIGFSGMALDGEVEDYEVAIYVPVELSSFTATAAGGAVELAWTTQSETENLGFSLYRSAAAEGPFERITGQIIPGAGSSTAAHSYRYKDITVAPGLNYWYRLADISLDGAMHMHKAVQVTVQPAEYSLEQNYPNPFNPVTTIRFSLREAGEVSLTVVNMQGQVVRTLVAARMEAGIHELRWDAKNEAGIPMPSGSYLCILKANGFNKTMQMTLLK